MKVPCHYSFTCQRQQMAWFPWWVGERIMPSTPWKVTKIVNVGNALKTIVPSKCPLNSTFTEACFCLSDWRTYSDHCSFFCLWFFSLLLFINFTHENCAYSVLIPSFSKHKYWILNHGLDTGSAERDKGNKPKMSQ